MENIANFEIDQDLRQSTEYGRYMEKIGWNVIKIPITRHQDPNKHQINNLNIQMFLRKIGPVGIGKIQRTKGELPMEEIEKIVKKERIFMCKIEPGDITPYPPLKLRGGTKGGVMFPKFRISTWPLLGTKTLRVNLKPGEDKIFDSFKKDCRYVLKKIINNQISITKNNFGLFYEIWRKSAKRKKLWIPGIKEYQSLIEVFGKKCFCLTVGDLAGAVILIHKKTAFYYFAGSTPEGVKQNLPYLIVWEAMKEAKNRGCNTWDFEGIYDERWPNKGWLGFSHFKKSFGGAEIEFPGSWEKWRLPI